MTGPRYVSTVRLFCAPGPGASEGGSARPSRHVRAATSVGAGGWRRTPGMHVDDTDLLARRLAAVRAWTAFVEHGDGAERAGAAGDLHVAGSARAPPITTDVLQAPLADEADTRRVLAGLAAADRRLPRRGRAAPYGRGRRPRARRHRCRHPHPVDVRRPGDAPQGRDGELRGRRPLGRRERRHERARPGQPARPAGDGLLAPSTTPRSCTTGSAGRRRSTTRSPAASSA